ncbi:MAG TPA: cellulase family glycosylhydrolase [Streptosporangiaceae bacterium]|jgi:endo-1,4-beta-mannosidase|nr:cellulase family glycosylhydrolase [Streptosporangiaceae bacterium]
MTAQLVPLQADSHYLSVAGRSLLPVGAHYVPVQGPDWPWRVGHEAFDQAFAAMAAAGLNAVRIDVLWAAVEPEPSRYDLDHLKQLDAINAAARRHGLWIHPALFIGGEVGDAYWDVPWRDGRHPHADRRMRDLQAAHAAMLASRWRGESSLLAWDLTDEPPFWIAPDTTDADAIAWTQALVRAIRDADPEHAITIGTSGQEVGCGPFRADQVADLLDFTCVHPYPIYQPHLYPDSLLSPRMTHAGAFETALAAGAGKPVMVHEYGASSAQFDPEAIAAYDRLLSWSSLGRGATGFFAWCWTDAEPAAYSRAPYVRQPHETQFGVTDHEGRLRPRGRVLADLAQTVGQLPLDELASAGPTPARAAVVVPHEFARPFDPGSFGLDAPSGLYLPVEATRGSDRDVSPLVRAWLNGFVMAARAGIATAFVRERLDHAWPEVPLILLPAPLASTSNTLLHVRTSYWSGAAEFLRRGGVLYLSCSADVAIPEMREITGCRIVDRAPVSTTAVLRFIAPWGPFTRGDDLVLPGGDGSLERRGVRLDAAASDILAIDASGAPALVLHRKGAGSAVVCSYPVETLVASVADAHGPGDRTWGLYAGLAELAGATDPFAVPHPDVTAGALQGTGGGVIVLTNHGPRTVDVPVNAPEGAVLQTVSRGGNAEQVAAKDFGLTIGGHAGAVVLWRPGQAEQGA